MPLIQYLLSHAANPNALCTQYDGSFGTGLDLFAKSLLNCERCYTLRCPRCNHSNRIYDLLIAWGAEFSRPFPSANEIAWSYDLCFCGFATDVIQLQLFPEQIDRKMFPPVR